MNNLVQAEAFKLRRNKTFWVLIVTITGLSALLHYLIMIGWWQVSGTPFDSAGLSELNALSAFTIPLLFNLIVSTPAAFFIANEFSDSGVIKNQVISGHKRSYIFMAKLLVFSLGAGFVTIVIPLLTAIIAAFLYGQGDLLTTSNLTYLGRAYSLFTLQFLGFATIVLLIAIVTEDSGKTILFTLLLSIVMFAIENLITAPFVRLLNEHSVFFQFSEVFNHTMTSGEMIESILIGSLTFIIISICGILVFNRKEI
ncbi:ABC transporter permease [Lentibacillus sp. CBA3610]|uniref:ABC transporter permease n=1 Tax=Lentibacillus sp. CBA3610 TaxID=2518176 RepID=UPI001595FBBB|nr:ABC transporter permease [Lentibacillus sp. CBA3610]QKY68405.1 ABC transporter permease [Lentibacillus sp. CBA3610]